MAAPSPPPLAPRRLIRRDHGRNADAVAGGGSSDEHSAGDNENAEDEAQRGTTGIAGYGDQRPPSPTSAVAGPEHGSQPQLATEDVGKGEAGTDDHSPPKASSETQSRAGARRKRRRIRLLSSRRKEPSGETDDQARGAADEDDVADGEPGTTEEVLIRPGELLPSKDTGKVYVETPGHFCAVDRAALEAKLLAARGGREALTAGAVRTPSTAARLERGWARLGCWAQGLLAGLALWQLVLLATNTPQHPERRGSDEEEGLEPLVYGILFYVLVAVSLMSALDRQHAELRRASSVGNKAWSNRHVTVAALYTMSLLLHLAMHRLAQEIPRAQWVRTQEQPWRVLCLLRSAGPVIAWTLLSTGFNLGWRLRGNKP
ncbi:transmembrane protein 237-like [Haemaphysalis longicornis]